MKNSYKEITGFDTPSELAAYEKGREHEEVVILRFIEGWDGQTNSTLGGLLAKKLGDYRKLRQSLAEMVNAFSFDKEFGPEQIHALNAAKRLLDSLEK